MSNWIWFEPFSSQMEDICLIPSLHSVDVSHITLHGLSPSVEGRNYVPLHHIVHIAPVSILNVIFFVQRLTSNDNLSVHNLSVSFFILNLSVQMSSSTT